MKRFLNFVNLSGSLVKRAFYSISIRKVPQNFGHVRPLKISLSDVPQTLKPDFIRLFHAIQSADIHELNNCRPDINLTSSTSINGQDRILLYNLLLEGLWKLSMRSDAEKTFRELLAQGFQPSFVTIEIMIDGALKHDDEIFAQGLTLLYPKYGLVPSVGYYNHWITYYLSKGHLDKAYSMLKEMRARSQRPNAMSYFIFLRYFINLHDWKAAEDIKLAMDSEGITPNLLFYSSLLHSLFKEQALSDVESLLELLKIESEEFKSQKDQTSLYTFFNVLVEGFASMGDLKRVQNFIETMRGLGCPPTVTTYNKIIDASSTAINNEQLKQIVEEMERSGVGINTHTYVSICKALILQGKYREALDFVRKLRGLPISVTTFGDLMQRCMDHKLYAGVEMLWDCMQEINLKPTNRIASILLRKALLHRKFLEAEKILQTLEESSLLGKSADTGIFAVLLEFFVENMHLDRIKAVLNWIKDNQISIDRRLAPLLNKAFFVYTKFNEGGMLTRAKIISEEETTEGKLSFSLVPDWFPPILEPYTKRFEELKKMAIEFEQQFGIPFKLSVHELNEILLHLMLENRAEDFLYVLKEMDNMDITPNLFTLTLAIKCRLSLGQSKIAHRLLKEAGKNGLTPTVFQCALVFHHHCKLGLTGAAEALLDEMIHLWKLRPNHVFFASLIYSYIKSRNFQTVFTTFEKMEASGFIPDTETCNYVAIALLESGRIEEAHGFLERMSSQGIDKNAYTFFSFADFHLNKGDVDKALECLKLANEPTEQRSTIDSFAFEKISNSLCNRADIHSLAKLFETVLEVGVCVSGPLVPGLRYAFYHHLCQRERDKARALLEKAFIDLVTLKESPWQEFLELLELDYLEHANSAEIDSWQCFKENVNIIREFFHRINPAIEILEISKPDDVYFRKIEVEQNPIPCINNSSGRLYGNPLTKLTDIVNCLVNK
jgi:pentatricopeptide repeat protein